MPGILYVVATPIGHLGDITHRAVDVLRSVATIAAEDTRRTRTLLVHLGIDGPRLVALHDHNERAAAGALVATLEAGADVALVSDAGTPLVCDPGFNLVRACRAAGIGVRPVPGASAIGAVLSVCSIPVERYHFEGFLPARSVARRARLVELLASPVATVFFEVPHRIEATLAAIEALDEGRELMLGREMTKHFEDYPTGTAAWLASDLRAREAIRGEFVGVIAASARSAAPVVDPDRVLAALLRELAPGKAARLTAEICGGARSDYYERALTLGRAGPGA
jgi:16S rRNA (cytidine1402-2'-O)-methyltransferase